jgi:hypothetical protein
MNETIAPTPEMVRQLNLQVNYKPNGEIISSRTRNRTLLDELVDKGFLEQYHVEYAVTFAMLRDVWLGKLGCRAATLSDSIHALCPHVPASELYDHVYSHIKPRRARLVFWAVESPAEAVIASTGVVMRDVMDILASAFTEAHKVLAIHDKYR